MMREVRIVGTGITPFGKFLDTPLRQLAASAITGALDDAGLTAEDLESAYAANAIAGLITGQEMVRGQVALRSMGVQRIPIVNVENACAGGSSALHLAWTAVAAGVHDVALVFGAERMTHEDKRKSIMAIATAMDVDIPVDPEQKSPFMSMYAERVKRWMAHSDITVEDFAAVVTKAQANGARNPNAQYGGQVSVDDVLASPMVAEPLTRLMCSPIGDGAAAVVIAAVERLDSLGIDDPGVEILASVVQSGSEPGRGPQAVARAGALAYEQASLGPEDLDVVELHDANAPAEIMRYEHLQLAPMHEGHRLLRDKATELGGRLPVNPSGGLLARGHPIGATGVAQVVELCDQLRGRAGDRQVDGAQVGLAENGGGTIGDDTAADSVHILRRA